MERVDLVRDGIYTRLFFRESRPVLLQAEPSGTVDKPTCRIILSGETTEEDKIWGKETVRWILNDHAPLEKFYSHIAVSDPLLAPLTESFRGLRFPLSPTLFETLVFAIVGQQVNLSFAYQCKAVLENNFTSCAIIGGQEYYAALSPENLTGARIADLRALKISNAKARAVLELADAFREKPLDRFSLEGKSNDEILKTLVSFRGVGPWTAEYTMLRALGKMDVLPAGDAGLQNALKRIYSLESKPSEEEVREIAGKWHPYAALATFYLWTGLMHEERSKRKDS